MGFDGVLHSYTTPWVAPYFIPDPPVHGAMKFLWEAGRYFDIYIFDARSATDDGRHAMHEWLKPHFIEYMNSIGEGTYAEAFLNTLTYPSCKPPAFLSIDDRALLFTGEWPNPQSLLSFKPWNKKLSPQSRLS